MLEFFKKLLGLAPKAVEVEAPTPAPYKVETPVPVIEAAAPAQVDKKEATGTTKSTAKKGSETGAKPARRRKKPAAT
jgi:hypothetical protein